MSSFPEIWKDHITAAAVIAGYKAEMIVVTLPLTPETRNMFMKKEFKLMMLTAFFINRNG
ncbi:NAD(P)-dependent oxidoreductase [Peribacillus simplex]|uniref:NAD(P)-dependent oxidoreductase n=1 Tax=Peribacillus simplex TaxID=1478 RepID=UPI0009704783|nr:NAD(P)-dependent oxidoreductase [Peribacillus simplex]